MIIGEPWGPSGAPKTFTADDGSKVTIGVHSAGIVYSDGGGTTQLAHVEDTDDPDVKKIGDSWFRRIR